MTSAPHGTTLSCDVPSVREEIGVADPRIVKMVMSEVTVNTRRISHV